MLIYFLGPLNESRHLKGTHVISTTILDFLGQNFCHAVAMYTYIIQPIYKSLVHPLGPDHLELIIFVIINKKIDNHPSRLITAKSIMHYRFSSALYW